MGDCRISLASVEKGAWPVCVRPSAERSVQFWCVPEKIWYGSVAKNE